MIKKLPDEVIRKIAAGEVIESPASVVRELVENAIDAGAKNIRIVAEESGKRMILVEDDGIGMSKDEIPAAVERFTTSKISSEEDLDAISTLGFRGEALHSIATVSKLTIKSGTEENTENSWEVIFNETIPETVRPAPYRKGTTVIVRDLFYNFPVRRKFLSGDLYEGRRIIEVVTTYALWNYDIGFELVINGNEVYNLQPATSYDERIEDIYGEDFIDETIEIHSKFGESLEITGRITRPEKMKIRPVIQLTLVNGRSVKSDQIRAAIYKALMEVKNYPEYIIFVKVDPHLIDFNIHPQKKDVRFSKSLRIFERFYRSIREVLETTKTSYLSVQPSSGPFLKLTQEKVPITREETKNARQLELGEMTFQAQQEESEGEEQIIPSAVWQAHNSYIIAEVKTGIIIIDQHAAHERVIYEQLLSRKVGTQSLLFPVTVHLTPQEMQVFNEYKEILENFGFRIRKFSQTTVVIEGIPNIFSAITKDEFKEILGELEVKKSLPDRFQYSVKTIACKAAIKAGDPLTNEEMLSLINQLFHCKNPYFCPHGRPTIIKIGLDELERKFGRH